MPRPRGTKDIAGRVTTDRRPGKCQGCGQPYQPRVAEALCRTCLTSILSDPDPWLGRLEALAR